ncbi:16S rRNA (guanine(966)-N(2))-methyltransferase RsmD [Hydrogenophaga sp.]|uniref:16S rRNA (guanine(966)-N(2))-methyltransferase RsmD n=1 Tax=Hydrogenophaga sp. TaxID=1904254 RepID=UPI0025BD5701|nr:16S rRNA (guanine(966)-N(2))-methyltransferase RsmD [Hydrogenophaga sp.]
MSISSKKSVAAPVKPRSAPRNEVRIIGGQWKRSKLALADRAGLRPTPSRVRETLFNWLGQDLNGWRCLDAFAGSGALGFEAASRGASEVLLVEQDVAALAHLQQIKLRLRADTVRVLRGDALAVLRQRSGQGLDLVFLDPPFCTDEPATLLLAALAAARACLTENGLIYLEAPRIWRTDELAALGLQVQRQGQAGQVAFHLLRSDRF